jgi:hypothetical protein
MAIKKFPKLVGVDLGGADICAATALCLDKK